MKVLVFCEFSGVVLDAFLAEGHDAYSADLLPTESEHKDRHFEGDGRWLLKEPWDLVIAHPPCTYLANSGVQYLHKREGRWDAMYEGAIFFVECLNANAPMVAVENPTMHRYAIEAIGGIKESFAVHPWMFGERASKRTCFWTKGLPPLLATEINEPSLDWHTKWAFDRTFRRSHERSKTFPKVAAAMAKQWGSL